MASVARCVAATAARRARPLGHSVGRSVDSSDVFSLLRPTTALDSSRLALYAAPLRRGVAAATGGRSGPAGDKKRFEREILCLSEPSELLDFFLVHRDALLPAHLCLIVERLQDADDGHADSRRALFNEKAFVHLVKEIARRLEGFGSRELPRLLAALWGIGWTDRQLFKVAEPMVHRHLPAMSHTELPRVLTSYVSLRCGSRVLYDDFVRCCMQHAADMGCSDLTDVIEAFSRSPHKPRAFLIGISPLVSERLQAFEPAQLARLTHAYATCDKNKLPRFIGRLAERLATRESQDAFAAMTAKQVVLIVEALTSMHKRYERSHRQAIASILWGASKQLYERGCRQLDPSDAGSALHAFAKTAICHPSVMHELYERVLESSSRLSDKLLARCLFVAARGLPSKQPQSVEKEAADVGDDLAGSAAQAGTSSLDLRLLDASVQRMQKAANGFEPLELTYVVLAYAMSHAGSLELFAVLQRAAHEASRKLNTEQIASLLWSFAMVRVGPSFFKEVQFDILDRATQLTVPSICDILWAYCAVRHYDPHFFQALLATIVPSKISGDPRCALLCPALLDIRARLPDIDPEGLERYARYARDEFLSKQHDLAAPADARRTIVEAAGEVLGGGCESEELAEVDGYLVDVVFRGDGNKDAPPLAVLYHSAPRTLHRLTKEPLGATMMRQRHLRHRGFQVLNLSAATWQELPLPQRAELLRERLPGSSHCSSDASNDASSAGVTI